MKHIRLIALFFSLLLGVLMTTAAAQMTPEGITVTGTGNTYGTPDVAIIDLGVDIAKENVNDASSEVNAVTARLIEMITGAGVDSKDIRTTYFNVWREVRYDAEGKETTPVYHVTNTLSITVRDVSKVGMLLNDSLTSGANVINGIQFTIANPQELEQQARSLAMQSAKAKASELAVLAGVTLGKVVSISEATPYAPGPLPYAADMKMANTSETPIAGGQLAVSINLTVTFAIEAK
jgi:uncharacterized protein